MKNADRERELIKTLLDIGAQCTGESPDAHARLALEHIYGPNWRNLKGMGLTEWVSESERTSGGGSDGTSTLRVRVDELNDRHAWLTIFQSSDGYNWANGGRICVDRSWFDDGPLQRCNEGARMDLELREATALARAVSRSV